jgi:transcriptional regulator with XRE-family HTH domain
VVEKVLGARIARLRREKGFTQQVFAERCGYSVEFISLVERGVNGPSISGLEKMAQVLGVPIKHLFEFDQEDYNGKP